MLDWDVREQILEKCVPLYGNLVCAQEVRHTYYCVLRAEDGNT